MNLSPTTPRLTDLPGTKHPYICQCCGGSAQAGLGNGILRLSIDRWQEHDHNDRKEHRLVVLCNVCSARIVKPHPRLYEKLQPAHPWPGCMALCLDCSHRDGVSCSHPNSKANGGPGVMLTIPKPMTAMVDGEKYRGPMILWTGAASACRERNVPAQ